MIQQAYDYISEGFGALPLNTDKSPRLPVGNNYLYSLIPDDQIESLFRQADKIGIACGEVSGGFMCLDFDCHGNENIEQIYRDFTKEESVKTIIKTYNLPIFMTPSGGYHIYFKTEDNKTPGRCLAKWQSKTVMIETRGHGQYVCLFPSTGYKQLFGSEIIKVSNISTEERDLLFAVAESFNQLIEAPATEHHGKGKWPEKFDTSKPIGKYNETEVKHAQSLLIAAGWQYIRTRPTDQVEMWLRPGKEIEGNVSLSHSATFGKFHNMFYVYTESDTVFSSWRGYTLFDILLKLKFNDDYHAALNFLVERYTIEEVAETSTEVSQEPETDQAESTPNMPVQGFPPFIQDLILECSRIYGTHPDLWAFAFLAATSAAIGQSVVLRTKYENPPLFWMAVVAPSGIGKTPPIDFAMQVLHDIDFKANEEHQKLVKQYLFDKEQSKNEKTAKPEEPPPCKQYLSIDTTPEALAVYQEANPRGITIIREELIGWLQDFGRYAKSGEQQNMLSSWSQQVFKTKRIGRIGEFIKKPFVNVFGGIQTGMLVEMAKDNRTINGFLQRFCFVFPDVIELPSYNNSDLSEEMKTKYKDYILKLLSVPGHRQEVFLTSEASDLYEDFYNKNARIINSRKQPDYLNECTSKLNIIILRAAILLHLSNCACTGVGSKQITPETMQAAIDLAEYFRITARKVHAIITQNGSNLKDVARFLHSLGNSQSAIAKILNVSQPYICKILR